MARDCIIVRVPAALRQVTPRRRGTLVLIWRRLLLTLVLPFALTSVAVAQSRQELIEGAKREGGEFVLYTSLSIGEISRLQQALEKQHPFLKAKFYRASGETVLNKALMEARAGQILFDVFFNTAFPVHLAQKANLLAPYHSPEALGYPDAFRHPQGYWTGVYNNCYVVAYNTKLVSPSAAPKRWEDLLHPRWKKQFALDREEFEWYGAMLSAMGEERGRTFMKALAAQEPLVRKGHTLIAQHLVAGEFPLALVYAHRIEEFKQKGAPVEWVTTMDPIIAGMRTIALSVRPKSPNAAKLFIDFVLSREGQTIFRDMDRIAVRPEIGLSDSTFDKSKLKLYPASPMLADRGEALSAEFRQLFIR